MARFGTNIGCLIDTIYALLRPAGHSRHWFAPARQGRRTADNEQPFTTRSATRSPAASIAWPSALPSEPKVGGASSRARSVSGVDRTSVTPDGASSAVRRHEREDAA